MSDDDVLSAAETATFLKVSVQTVIKESREGGLPGRKVGREWRYHRQALVKHLGQYGGQQAASGCPRCQGTDGSGSPDAARSAGVEEA